ncbi:MAG: N-acetylmuramoyl-L-alanine amidase [Pseudomonadota bacterium]
MRPDMVVVHYTAMATPEAALARLCDPAAEVSAHYLIAEDGRVWRLVDETRRAWHAGRSAWGGIRDVNSHSIGIELANPGIGAASHPFPEPQMRALEALLGEALVRWAIRRERVVGHACVAPGRKIDPGNRFDWRRLALQGLAVWTDGPPVCAGSASPERFRSAARRFGYALAASGGWDAAAAAVWEAFALRFRPREAGQASTSAGVSHLEDLAARWPVVDPLPIDGTPCVP